MTFGSLTARRLRQWCAVLATAAALASCGGGTAQYEPFQPGRVLAFGDENSVLTDSGRKYSVNALDDSGAIACATEPLWIQSVANNYGFVFAQCNPAASTSVQAVTRASAGARVADLAGQIDAQVAQGALTDTDLVMVLVGAHDILDQYATFPAQSEAQITETLRARGEQLAAQVNRLVDLGARVIVSTVPDLGVTPYALAQKAAHTDVDRAALLSRLTAAFNGRMRVNILNDGRFVGLVLADELIQAMVRSPSFYALANVTEAACTVALPDCTASTLVSGATSTGYLWADDLHLAYGGQFRLGSLALARARGNPF